MMDEKNYRLSEIGEMMEAESIITENDFITEILTDSRSFRKGENFLFIAIRGRKEDGHDYVKGLYDKGVRSFVVERKPDLEKPDANWLVVSDSLSALQKFAGAHRRNFNYPVWGITGSNGKTVVKEWLFQLLSPDKRIVRSPRSYNSKLGVPLSLWLMREGHELALMECGISQKGEMAKLEEMVKPDLGIFTTIGPAHQENFDSYEEKVIEKMELFRDCPELLYCADHTLIHDTAKRVYTGKRVTWAENAEADLRIMDAEPVNDNHVEITGKYMGRLSKILIPFRDRASFENACLCWLALLHHGMADQIISERMAKLAPVAMRLEKIAGINNCTVINDAYNSDFASLNIALEFQAMKSKQLKRVVILSDILQTGEKPESLYRKVADLLEANGVKLFIGIGPTISKYARCFEKTESKFYDGTDQFLEEFATHEMHEMSILVKGSRVFRFERIVQRLEARNHETVLEINLNLMIENLNYIRSLLKPTTKLMAMVKAFAYGTGAKEVATILEYSGVDYLAVAYVDEGVSLRKAGIGLPILVLNPESSAYDAMIRYRLEPQIYSFRTLGLFLETLRIYADQMPYPVHIKINTGMNRLGFDLADISALAERLTELQSQITPRTVFSHLAASDGEEFDELTKRQIARFQEACAEIHKAGIKSFERHLLNSNGILRHPEAQMDMVRLGLGLYGLSSNEKFRKKLKPIHKLQTVISQIREVEKGEGIGYSPKELLTEKKSIGVIAMGYADGLPRKLGNGRGCVRVNGKMAPFIGNICMDMAMIDLSGIDCKEGDQVEVFGDHISIYQVAKNLETIPYEALTNISQRVKRVFYKE